MLPEKYGGPVVRYSMSLVVRASPRQGACFFLTTPRRDPQPDEPKRCRRARQRTEQRPQCPVVPVRQQVRDGMQRPTDSVSPVRARPHGLCSHAASRVLHRYARYWPAVVRYSWGRFVQSPDMENNGLRRERSLVHNQATFLGMTRCASRSQL
jgi:hypothetical protein